MISKYLNQFETNTEINIIGPLFAGDCSLLKEPIIYVDGGAKSRKDNRGIVVGDGDSFSGALDIKLDQEKDLSDLSYVLQHIPENIAHLNLLGFLGGRRDHELFNIGEGYHLLDTSETKISLNWDEEVLMFSKGTWAFSHIGTFSIATFKNNRIVLSGSCRYAYKGVLEKYSSHGLSNEGEGEIEIFCDKPVIIYKV